LQDVETGESLTSEADDVAQTVARAAMADHATRLRRFSSRSGIAFTSWDVALPWQRVLLDHLVRARAA
jgi:hypothetical protein